MIWREYIHQSGKGFLDAFFDFMIVCHGELENIQEIAEYEEGIKCDLISCFWSMQAVRLD